MQHLYWSPKYILFQFRSETLITPYCTVYSYAQEAVSVFIRVHDCNVVYTYTDYIVKFWVEWYSAYTRSHGRRCLLLTSRERKRTRGRNRQDWSFWALNVRKSFIRRLLWEQSCCHHWSSLTLNKMTFVVEFSRMLSMFSITRGTRVLERLS